MKVLSLWQPWATLVIIGAKRFETRHWSTSYRGELGIHAAKKVTRELRDLCRTEPFRSTLADAGFHSFDDLPLGALLGTSQLVSIFKTHAGRDVMHDVQKGPASWRLLPTGRERAFGDFSPGRYAWQFEDLVWYEEPVPCRGAQGLFDPTPRERIESVRQAELLF